MDTALTVSLGAAALAVLVLGALLLVVHQGRRRLRAELAASRAELVALRERVDALTAPPSGPAALPAEFVITELGTSGRAPEPTPAPSRTFVSVAAGESLVRLVSLGYGVRRALSAQNRNRIAFEMRRELKRARKQRRRDLKEARRSLRAEESAA